MKIWTYLEMVTKLKKDLDLEDEKFIKSDEFAGYFNEALGEAESEIMVTNQDYLLTKAVLPVVSGTTDYELPDNIYANKIRNILYRNGSTIYEVPQFRRSNKFENMALIEQSGVNEWYQYLLINDNPGQAQIRFLPTMRDTATMYPYTSIVAPLSMWYIRNCVRVPMLGEYCNPEVIAMTGAAGGFSQVSTLGDSILSFAGTKYSYGPKAYGIVSQALPGSYPGSIRHVTGDAVKVRLGPGAGAVLPSPLVEGTTYYVIATGTAFSNGYQIKLASTRALAFSGTAIDLTTTGTGNMILETAATEAIRSAVRIDIPEFATFIMQWVKCRCLEKEGDPRIEKAGQVLVQQKKQMIDTLTQAIVDDDDILQGDFSSYWEMN